MTIILYEDFFKANSMKTLSWELFFFLKKKHFILNVKKYKIWLSCKIEIEKVIKNIFHPILVQFFLFKHQCLG